MRLLRGDCLKRMNEIGERSVDLVLADPPHGTTACKWDAIIPLQPMWEQLERILAPHGAIVIIATQPFTTTLIASNIRRFKYCWVWDKIKPSGHLVVKYRPMQRTEDICVFGFGRVNYYPIMERRDHPKRSKEYKRTEIMGGIKTGSDRVLYRKYPQGVIVVSNASQRDKQHPTQKPIALLEYLIRTYSKKGDMVLDFAMGSGSTGVAAKNLNREFIGIEIDRTFFRIAKRRIHDVQL